LTVSICFSQTFYFSLKVQGSEFKMLTFLFYLALLGAPATGQELPLPKSEINDFVVDNSGVIWLATDRGLFQTHGDSLLHFTEKDGLPADSISSLVLVPGGKIWLGSSQGAASFDGRRFATFSFKDGLLDKRVSQLFLSESGLLWACTPKGPHAFEQGQFKVLADLKNIPVTEMRETKSEWIFATEHGFKRILKKSEGSANWLPAAGLLSGFLLIGLFFHFGTRLKRKSELMARVAQIEQQALLVQMSPHFIFNSLNSVQKYILQHERETAHEYLADFSQLMRKILDNSRRSTTSLGEEIELLKLYLQGHRSSNPHFAIHSTKIR